MSCLAKRYVRSKVDGEHLIHYLKCDRCGKEYERRNLSNINGLCSYCDKVAQQERAEARLRTVKNKAKEAIVKDLEIILDPAPNVIVNGEEYVLKSVISDRVQALIQEGINDIEHHNTLL